MRLDITGRHVEITPPVRQLLARRLARLERMLNDAAVSAIITLTKEKYRLRTEIVVHTKGDHVLRGNGEGNALPLSVRMATEKIEQQAKKLKGKWAGRKRQGAGSSLAPASPQEAPAPRIVRATRYAIKPMSVEDAALLVDGDRGGETFIVFRNGETDAISILYRRKDGNLGLIEPD